MVSLIAAFSSAVNPLDVLSLAFLADVFVPFVDDFFSAMRSTSVRRTSPRRVTSGAIAGRLKRRP
jgi:hypothetical protein